MLVKQNISFINLEHRNSYLKPGIYTSNLGTDCHKNNYTFHDINNMFLIKHMSTDQKRNLWENTQI